MGMRALSGVIFTRGARAGIAVIRFHPYDARVEGIGATEGVGVVEEMADAGPEGPFRTVPCKHVALRQITQLARSSPHDSSVTFAIDDEIARDRLTIEWRTEGDTGFMSEISYLVIGDVG